MFKKNFANDFRRTCFLNLLCKRISKNMNRSNFVNNFRKKKVALKLSANIVYGLTGTSVD